MSLLFSLFSINIVLNVIGYKDAEALCSDKLIFSKATGGHDVLLAFLLSNHPSTVTDRSYNIVAVAITITITVTVTVTVTITTKLLHLHCCNYNN